MIRRSRLASATALVALFASSAALAACSTILGFDDVTLDDGGLGADASDGGQSDGPGIDSPIAVDGPTGDAPGADAPPDTATCGNTMTDPLNCGRCGHNCFKGMCQAGVCQPFALATGYLDTWDLAVDGTSVYFTNIYDNTIFKVSKFDGSNALKIADQPDAFVPFGIAVDATSVYWTNRSTSGEVRRCALTGCAANTSTLLATANNPTAVLVVGSSVFWAANGSGDITRADATDGGNPLAIFPASAGANPYQLANDVSYVYATDNQSGMTRRVPLGGGAAVTLANNGVTKSSGIAVGAGGIYFTGGSFTDGVVWRITAPTFVNGATASPFASSQHNPAGVAVDATNVYWVATGDPDQNNGFVLTCPLTGCAQPTVLASGQHYPVRIKVDADAVYWTNNGQSTGRDGSIWKVAKP